MRNYLLPACLSIAVFAKAQNVGVGETFPSAKLEIKSSSAAGFPFRIKTSSNDNVLEMYPADFYHAVFLGGFSSGATGALNISNRYFGSLGSPHLRLNAHNNSGGGSQSRLVFSNESDVNSEFAISTYSGTNLTAHHFTLSHLKALSSRTLMMFDDDAKMGIGMSSSGGKVSIGHNSTVSSPTVDLIETEDDFARLSFTSQHTGAFWTIAGRNSTAPSNRRLNFYNSVSGDVMSITGDGNVGIGTTSPSAKLEVDGTIKLDNELNRAATGSANLVPIAYGNISAAGAIHSGSGNFTVSRISAGFYAISITGHAYQFQTFTATVTPVGGGIPIIPSTGSGSNNLYVYTFNVAGAATDSQFCFVVYRQ